MKQLTDDAVKSLIDRVGPSLGYDYTQTPVFPEGRTDVCAVCRTAENGKDYGYDTVYLVWMEPDGSVKYKAIKDSRATKDNISIGAVTVGEDGEVSVSFGSGGSFSGVPWGESMRVAIVAGEAQVSAETPATFDAAVAQMMEKVVEGHRPCQQRYQPTRVVESVLDADRKIAVFILKEQIDSDRSTSDSEGWLGDQFRFSIWKIEGGEEPIQLYEEHDYIRPRSISHLTGTRGRDCSLKSLRLEGNTITVEHLKGDTVEEQAPEDMQIKL